MTGTNEAMVGGNDERGCVGKGTGRGRSSAGSGSRRSITPTLPGWLPALAIALALIQAACGSSTPPPPLDNPYETCNSGDACSTGLSCLPTTLPASAGYTGYLCTSGCNTASDCLQDVNTFSAICVNAQCYIQCPSGGGACPYGTGCLAFSDQSGNEVDLCTP